MPTRNFNRDYDRDEQHYGQYNRRPDQGRYGRSRWDTERYGSEGRFIGDDYEGRYSSERGRESGRDDYWGRGWENERDNDDRGSRYGNYGRENYGHERDRERGRESRLASYGRSGAERGYSEGLNEYSQRYDYPTGFRSETYGGGRGYNYDRQDRYDRSDNRGWWDRASDEVASWFGDEEAERRRHMDQQRDERRGRGPKGYRRSDERIKEDVNDRLSDDYYIDASDVEVMVQNTEVTLTGTVPSRRDKRRAEDIADSVSGVTNVENRLRVKQSGYNTYSSSSEGTTGTSSTGTPGTTTSSAAAGGQTRK